MEANKIALGVTESTNFGVVSMVYRRVSTRRSVPIYENLEFNHET